MIKKMVSIVQGNWWEINSTSGFSKKYTYEQFIEEVKKRIGYLKGLKLDEEYYIDEIKTVLEKEKYDSFVQIEDQRYYPILTFHGTTDPAKINSIIKYGYLIPGELHPGDGRVMSVCHGGLYGDGIYTSNRFNVAGLYSFLDQYNYIQLIINIQFLGKVINHPQPGKDDSIGISLSLDGLYDGEFHTRHIFQKGMFVAASGSYVHPVLVVTLRPKTDYSHCTIHLD